MTSEPRLLSLPKHEDERGNLTFVEGGVQVPFEVRRVYWIYDVPGGATRGGHAFYEQQELVVALSGSFQVVLTDGEREVRFVLNRSYYGLYVPPGWWRQMVDFSTNSVALVLSSTDYSASDYIYNYAAFLQKIPRVDLNAQDVDSIGFQASSVLAFDPIRTSIADCLVQSLNRIASSRRGNLTPLYGNGMIPFAIRRLFYIYDIPGGFSRGGHAHKECHQYFVAVSGSFKIRITDGVNEETVFLNRPYEGFHLVPGIWAQETEFSSGAVCLVLTSHSYDDSDYLRDWSGYTTFKGFSSL